MTQKIGLVSEINNRGGQKGASEYNAMVSQMEKHTANVANSINNTFSKIGSAASNSTSGLSKLASGLGGIATVAGGIVAANLFNKMAEGLTAFVSEGLRSVDAAQRLETGLNALLAQNNLYEKSTETLTVAVGDWAEIQAEAAGKMDDLSFKQKELTADINKQQASIQEQKERIRQLTEQWGAEGLATQEAAAQLQVMEVNLEGLQRDLAKTGQEQGKLTNLQQEFTTVTKTSYDQVMQFGDAQKLAAQQSKDLLSFVEKLSITSPFESEQVALVTKFAVAAGLGVDETKAFTTGFLDLSAAVGIGSEGLAFAADQLLQVSKVGKLTEIDLRQLRRVGIDLEKIIGVEMGMSIEEFNKEAEKSPDIFNKLFASVATFSQNTFAGTAEKMATSLSGLKSTFNDIFSVSSKNLLRPIVEALSPMASNILGNLATIATGPELAQIGQDIGKKLTEGIATITAKGQELFDAFKSGGGEGLLKALGVEEGGIELFTKISDSFTAIGDAITSTFLPALDSITASGVMDTINTGLNFLNEHFEEIKGAIVAVAAVLAGGAVAGAIAGIATAIAGLMSPVGLLVAGAALLGAAWGGNWLGIRDKTMEAWTAIQPALSQLVTWLQANIPVAVQMASDIWTNTLLPALTQVGTWIDTTLVPAFTTMWTWLGTNIPVAVQTLTDFWNSTLLPAFTAVGDFINNTLVPAFTTIWTWLATNIPPAIQTLSDTWTNTLLPALQTGYDNFSLMVDLLESLGRVVNAVLSKALEALAGIWQNILLPALTKVWNLLKDSLSPMFTSMGATIEEDVSPVLSDLGEVVMPLLQEGIEFVTEAIKDMIAYFNSMADAVSSFELPDILTPGSPPPMAYALMDIATGAGQAEQAIKGMQKTLLTSAGSADRFIDSLDMGGFAEGLNVSNWNDLRDILKLNIRGGMGALAGGLSGGDIMGQVMQQAKAWNVPPQFAQEIAKANGLIDHFTSTFAAFKKEIAIENLDNMLQMGSQFSSLGSTFADMLKEQMGDSQAAKDAINKLMESTNKLTGSNSKLTSELDNQQKQLNIYQQELANLNAQEEKDLLAIEKKTLQIEKLTEAMDKNKAAIQANQLALAGNQQGLAELATSGPAGLMESLRAFLAGNEATFRMFKQFEDGTTSEFFWDRNRAQEEFNKLLEEQKKREELITKQKEAQQKLDFLRAQLDLIKLGQQLGGNIFEGMTFGINASVEDLLAATNAVTEALVNQIQTDLQIASPSKLMTKFGKFIPQGLAKGIMSGQGMVSGAIGAVAGMVSKPFGGNTDNRNYSRTNNMPVVINNYGGQPKRLVNDLMMLRARTSRI